MIMIQLRSALTIGLLCWFGCSSDGIKKTGAIPLSLLEHGGEKSLNDDLTSVKQILSRKHERFEALSQVVLTLQTPFLIDLQANEAHGKNGALSEEEFQTYKEALKDALFRKRTCFAIHVNRPTNFNPSKLDPEQWEGYLKMEGAEGILRLAFDRAVHFVCTQSPLDFSKAFAIYLKPQFENNLLEGSMSKWDLEHTNDDSEGSEFTTLAKDFFEQIEHFKESDEFKTSAYTIDWIVGQKAKEKALELAIDSGSYQAIERVLPKNKSDLSVLDRAYLGSVAFRYGQKMGYQCQSQIVHTLFHLGGFLDFNQETDFEDSTLESLPYANCPRLAYEIYKWEPAKRKVIQKQIFGLLASKLLEIKTNTTPDAWMQFQYLTKSFWLITRYLDAKCRGGDKRSCVPSGAFAELHDHTDTALAKVEGKKTYTAQDILKELRALKSYLTRKHRKGRPGSSTPKPWSETF